MSEPLILVIGNCQAHALAAILAAESGSTVCILHRVYGFRPSFRGVQPFIIPVDEAPQAAARFRNYGRQTILVEQTTPLAPPLPADFIPEAPRARFPYLQLQSFWQESATPISADRRRRFLDFDLAGMRRSESAAGLSGSLTDCVAAAIRSRPAFWMPVHPDAGLLVALYEVLCAQLRDFSPTLAHLGGVDMMELLDFYSEHPLLPKVVDALDLEWAKTDWYKAWSDAVRASEMGHWEESVRLHEVLLSIPGRNDHVWATFAKALEGAGRVDRAHGAYGIAHRRYPQNTAYAQNWVRTLSNSSLTSDQEPFIAELKQIYDPFGEYAS